MRHRRHRGQMLVIWVCCQDARLHKKKDYERFNKGTLRGVGSRPRTNLVTRLMALYFAPIDAASNSGRLSFQIFRTSSLITGRTLLDAERKAFVRAIEFDLA